MSHVMVALIDKVPSPMSANMKIAYLTNVYTRPAYRGRGIGARLVKQAQEACQEAHAELMLVWPSEASVAFYQRRQFEVCDEPLVWRP